MKKLKIVAEQARDTRLPRGNPTLAVTTQRITEEWPTAARLLHGRLNQGNLSLRHLTHGDRYDRWLVRCLLKANLVRVVTAAQDNKLRKAA